MAQVTVYHNPRCTKSRQTLALLQDQGIQPEIIEYLKEPPDAATLSSLLKKLRIEPHELIRQKEYHRLGLPEADSPQKLITLMSAHPEIIERPIVVCGRKATLGRPPENVLEIL